MILFYQRLIHVYLSKHQRLFEKERTIRTLFAAIVFYSDFNLVNRYVCSHVKGRR